MLDKNDSPPVFRDTPLSFNVSEDLGAGHHIATIRASDPDTLGSLTFSLFGGGDEKFLLEPETGRLYLKDALDRELKDKYVLHLRVADGVQSTDTTAEVLVSSKKKKIRIIIIAINVKQIMQDVNSFTMHYNWCLIKKLPAFLFSFRQNCLDFLVKSL